MSGVLIVFRTLCALSIVLGTIPMIWHWQNQNIPAICLIIWLMLLNICSLANSFIWPNDLSVWIGFDGAVFCDIQVKIFIAGTTGMLGAIAAMARNLAKILSDNITVVRTKAVRRRELLKDLCLCLGIPLYMMLVHYIVQPSRYYLYSVTGCTAVVDRSWPSIVLLFIWPPVAALVAGYFAGLVIYRLHKYRRRFSALLSSNSNLTKGRFIRLFVLSCLLLIFFVPVVFYVFYTNINVDRIPYDWGLVHGEEWFVIERYPLGNRISFDRWMPIGTGLLMFLFFGLGNDALSMYKAWLCTIGLGKRTPTTLTSPNSSLGSLNSSGSGGSWFSRNKAKKNTADTTTTQCSGTVDDGTTRSQGESGLPLPAVAASMPPPARTKAWKDSLYIDITKLWTPSSNPDIIRG